MVSPSWIRKALELRGIPFEETHHREAYTAQEVAHHEHFSGNRVAKVVVVMADGRPVELILPASKHVNLDRVRTALHVHEIRLATEEEMERYFTDCEVGAIPALRHWKDVEVLMDRSLNVEGQILFQAGTHADAVRLNFRDWYEMVNPQVAAFSELGDVADAERSRIVLAEFSINPMNTEHMSRDVARVLEVLQATGLEYRLGPMGTCVEDGREISFHRHSILHEGFDDLRIGTEVAFVEEEGKKVPQASTVKPVGTHGHR
jgi:Ala-tRNA(Pro) deacylase